MASTIGGQSGGYGDAKSLKRETELGSMVNRLVDWERDIRAANASLREFLAEVYGEGNPPKEDASRPVSAGLLGNIKSRGDDISTELSQLNTLTQRLRSLA